MGSMMHPLAVDDGSVWVGEIASAAAGCGLQLRADAVVLHRGALPAHAVDWSDVQLLEVSVKRVRWRFPTVMSWVLHLLAGLIDLWSPGLPDEIDATIETGDGRIDHTFFAHNRGGYPQARVEALHLLVDLLVRQPAARAALADPAAVLRAFDDTVAGRRDDVAGRLEAALLDIAGSRAGGSGPEVA